MKPLFFAILLICANGAFAQSYTSSQPNVYVVPDHPDHAWYRQLAQEQNLRGETSPYTYAQGEIPLKEVRQASIEIPLGDVARGLRKQHEAAKKAAVIWEN